MRVYLVCLFLCGATSAEESNNIKRVMTSYFNSPSYRTFQEQWNKFKKPIENSLESVLRETYADESMNVYVRRLSDPHKLKDGFFVDDNIVKLLLKDLYLTQLPHLTNPEVSFTLAAHVLQVEAKVDRMFIQADYQLFRNLSEVSYTSAKLDPYTMSPFNLQQVKSDGEVTIVAEDCTLTGIVMAMLHDETVNLGHDALKLVNCKFSVEISTPGLGSPPVIAPYFSREQGERLELILVKPIREELLPKLQGAVFTYVNTSAIFGDNLRRFRTNQKNLFRHTSAYLTRLTRQVNQRTLEGNHGTKKWNNIVIQWSDKLDEIDVQDYKVVLSDITVTGLDSAYSAQDGGPYKLSDLRISDTVRFSALQIRGTLTFSVGKAKRQYVFYGEMHDVTSSMSIQVNSENEEVRKPPETVHHFDVYGWRNMDLHAPDIPLISPHSLISGIILNELPNLVIQRLFQSFIGAVEGTDNKPPEQSKLLGDNKNSADEDEPNKDIAHEINVKMEHEDDNETNKDIAHEVNVKMEHEDDNETNKDIIAHEVNVKMEHEDDGESFKDIAHEMNVKMEHEDDDNKDLVDNANIAQDDYNDADPTRNNVKQLKHSVKQLSPSIQIDKNIFGKVMFDNKVFGEKGEVSENDDVGVERRWKGRRRQNNRNVAGKTRTSHNEKKSHMTDNEVHSE